MGTKRDFRKVRVDAVRAERAVDRRLDQADPSTSRDFPLCEKCAEVIYRNQPMRRVNRRESPSGEGGYVHEECMPSKEAQDDGLRGEHLRVTSPSPNPMRSPSQIEEAARSIWKELQSDCKKNGLAPTNYGDAYGYYMTGSITAVARRLWPRTQFNKSSGKTAMNMIRSFLRVTGNVVILETGGNRRQSRMFVAFTWQHKDAVLVPFAVPTPAQVAAANKEKEARRLERKLTPEEAGETREPAPIEIREGYPVHPEYGPSEQHPEFPDVIRFSNGMCQCRVPGCGKVLKPQGVPPHMKMHANESLEQEVIRLRGLVATGLENFQPNQALDALTVYIRGLETQVQALESDRTGLEQQLHALDSECAAKVDLIKEVMGKFSNGEIKVLRAMSDIADILEA